LNGGGRSISGHPKNRNEKKGTEKPSKAWGKREVTWEKGVFYIDLDMAGERKGRGVWEAKEEGKGGELSRTRLPPRPIKG